MIKAYLTAIPSLYEGEDVEVRYSLFRDDQHIIKESIYLEYMKPAIVSLVSLLQLFKKLEAYKEEEIEIIINDSSLFEAIKGASTTRNGDVIKMANKARKQLDKFDDLSFTNVTKDKMALANWREILEN
ncbi:MAG: hypothetical protein RR313_06765 [Anaerovoracaceae bacterium]